MSRYIYILMCYC